jgi:hypothetical protein
MDKTMTKVINSGQNKCPCPDVCLAGTISDRFEKCAGHLTILNTLNRF